MDYKKINKYTEDICSVINKLESVGLLDCRENKIYPTKIHFPKQVSGETKEEYVARLFKIKDAVSWGKLCYFVNQ